MDAPSDTEVECPPCIDSDTWRSAHLGYACSDYRIGGASEGYCEDVGSISTAPDAPSLEGTALQHCPRACGSIERVAPRLEAEGERLGAQPRERPAWAWRGAHR